MSAPPWGDAQEEPPRRRSVSVVVTHYEQAPQLERTLRALREQTLPPYQVVVADDGSRELPRVPPGVEVVTQPDRGFRAAAARNRAAARCHGELLVLLDADTTPEPTYLARLTAPLLRDPELLVVGRRRYADATHGVLAEPRWLQQGYEDTADLRRSDATSYRFVIAAVMACSRWWFEEIGGFDERFTGYGGEDWELAHRSWRHGGRLAHVPEAVAWHDGPAVGETGRPVAAAADQLRQTTAVAARVGAPGAGYRGFLAGPAEVVVTIEPGLDAAEVVLTLDCLLSVAPRVRLRLAAAVEGVPVEDPRVEVAGAEATRPATWLDTELRLHLHLTRPVTGDAPAWAAVLSLADGVDPAARTVVTSTAGAPCAVLHDLRQYRRARRRGVGESELTQQEAGSGLRDAGGRTLQWWLQR